MTAPATQSPPEADRVLVNRDVIITASGPRSAPEALAGATGLSKLRIKDAMLKGAVWLQRGTRKPQRLRRITTPLEVGDKLSLHYDSAVLTREPPAARLVADHKRYSVWWKPAGLMVEGSRFGDHATLARQIGVHFEGRRDVHLVHRLDLEASGLVIAGHGSGATARLSALFQARTIDKRYRVTVKGDLRARGERGRIDLALDEKPAVTEYRIESVDAAANTTTVEVRMATGRYHQIRRHFAAIGTPVLGDPRYGRGASSPAGLQLSAVGIAFVDPFSQKPVVFGECTPWDLPATQAP